MKHYFTSWTVYSGGAEFDQCAVFVAENKRAANRIVKDEFFGCYNNYGTDSEGHGYRSGGCREITKEDYDVLKKYV
jgi:hypothetical protein